MSSARVWIAPPAEVGHGERRQLCKVPPPVSKAVAHCSVSDNRTHLIGGMLI